MTTIQALCGSLAELAPLALAESWDNVGLLVGDRQRSIGRVMTCLTISPDVVDEAIDENVDVIVAHHPLPFKSLQRITSDTIAGKMLLRLIGADVAIYSAHTAFDSAALGINQMWADALTLQQCVPLIPSDDPSGLGAGRVGVLSQPITFGELVTRASQLAGATAPRRVGDANKRVSKIAFACGSGGSFLSATKRSGCEALITGEATFHTCLEAESLGIGLGLLGHYWSERFAMERMSEQIAAQHDELTVWPSRREHDPIEPAGH